MSKDRSQLFLSPFNDVLIGFNHLTLTFDLTTPTTTNNNKEDLLWSIPGVIFYNLYNFCKSYFGCESVSMKH